MKISIEYEGYELENLENYLYGFVRRLRNKCCPCAEESFLKYKDTLKWSFCPFCGRKL